MMAYLGRSFDRHETSSTCGHRACAALAILGCGEPQPDTTHSAKAAQIADMKRATDHHSYAKPSEAVTTHLSWDAEVDFASRQIHATATYDLDLAEDAQRVLLDCRGLDIQAVQVDGQAVEFELGPERPFIGQP